MSAAEKIPTELHDVFAQAMLGSAVHRTLETLLPAAGSVVECATKDLSERFVALAAHADAQRKIVEHALALAESSSATASELYALGEQSAALGKAIDETIGRLVMGLQFQDRNSQIMENAVRMLRQYEELQHTLKPRHPRLARWIAGLKVESLLEVIHIADVREHFNAALAHLHIFRPADPAATEVPDDAVEQELF